MSLEAVPCDIADANAFVAQHHRHNRPVTVARFAIAAAKDGKVVGVSIVGNPVARSLNDGWTLEVVRLATDGEHNACSFLYGASWRAARALGWRKLITYTRKDEGGGQLTSCGVEGRCRGEGSVLVLPVAPSRGPGTSAGQVQMGGSMSRPCDCGTCRECGWRAALERIAGMRWEEGTDRWCAWAVQVAHAALSGAPALDLSIRAELARPSPPPEVERGKCGECGECGGTGVLTSGITYGLERPCTKCGTGREGTNG